MREGGRFRQIESLQRARALYRDECILVGGVTYLGSARLALLEPLVDRLAIRRVDDEEVLPVREAIGDQVVEDSAALVRQQRVLRLAVGDALEIVLEHLLKEGKRSRAVHVELPHVGHVERAGVRAYSAVLGDHALVLDGHLPTCERNHPRARVDVARVQRRALQRGLHGRDSSSSRLRRAP
jgi:hypothetical protein